MNTTTTKFPSEEQNKNNSVISHEMWGAVVLQLCLFSLIAVVGFIANVMVLVAASQLRRLRNNRSPRSTYYIINLAVADLAIILLALPTDLLPYFSSWPFGEFACRFLYPLRDVFVFVAIMTVTGLSIERYWVITGPFKTKPNPKHARVIIMSIWVVGYLFSALPLVFVMKLVDVSNAGKMIVCETVWRSETERKVHVLLTIMVLVFPSCIITFCYIRIAKSLQRLQMRRTSNVGIEGKPTSSVISLVAQSKKVAKMLVIIVVAFCCCVVPFTLWATIIVFGSFDPGSNDHIVYSIMVSLFFAHSAVNPVILIIMSKEYRMEVVRIARALKEMCWKTEIRAYFARFTAQKDYHQHRKGSDNRDQLVRDPEGEPQQKSTEL